VTNAEICEPARRSSIVTLLTSPCDYVIGCDIRLHAHGSRMTKSIFMNLVFSCLWRLPQYLNFIFLQLVLQCEGFSNVWGVSRIPCEDIRTECAAIYEWKYGIFYIRPIGCVVQITLELLCTVQNTRSYLVKSEWKWNVEICRVSFKCSFFHWWSSN
jgi:hypothetical protein